MAETIYYHKEPFYYHFFRNTIILKKLQSYFTKYNHLTVSIYFHTGYYVFKQRSEDDFSSMNLIKWSYTKRYNIKGIFDIYPNSTVIFRKIKEYYFVYTVQWSPSDPVVVREDLEIMEELLNEELGTLAEYLNRKNYRKINQ